MRIGFDAKRAFHNLTGLGNYSRSLILTLAEYYPDNEYLLYTAKTSNNPLTEFNSKRDNIKVITPVSFSGNILKSLWRSRLISKQINNDNLDLYHGLSNELPVGIKKSRAKTIVTIHDLIFLRYPKTYRMFDRIIYKRKVEYACNNADKIIAVSEQSKDDIISFLKIDSDKIEVIYQNCDSNFYKQLDRERLKEMKDKYSLPDEYLLNVGRIEERKNLLSIIKALKILKETINPFLVVIGNGEKYFTKVKTYVNNAGLDKHVKFLTSVPFSDFPALYQGASLFIYPSLFEGFGIPIIEALNSKTPVITSRGSCFAEAGGPDSIYIDPTNVNQLAETILTTLSDKVLQKRIVENGYEYAQRFHEKNVSKNIMKVYSDLLSE